MTKFISIFICWLICAHVALGQAVVSSNDSTALYSFDSTTQVNTSSNNYGNLIQNSHFLNTSGKPESLKTLPVKHNNNVNLLFYFVSFLLLLFGFIKRFYERYFTTLFQVFFNTSLKQNQLTDQLVQAKLPSLFFNILFVLTGGFYIFVVINLLNGQKIIFNKHSLSQLFYAIDFVLCCYVIKFLGIKFLGWLTDHKDEASSYIFIIFLLNKIMGVFLLCILPLLIFVQSSAISNIILFSLIIILLLFLLRYYRSFSILQIRLRYNFFNLLLYVLALEVIPFVIIFKVCNQYLLTKP